MSILIFSLGFSNNFDIDKDKLLINHLGYHVKGAKKVVFQTKSEVIPDYFEIRNRTEITLFKGEFEKGGKIDNWHTGNAYAGYFTDFEVPWEY